MDTAKTIREILGETLQLGERSGSLQTSTVLFGGIPEFDSMAVVTVISAMEDRFGFVVEDEEISAETFETVGSLTEFAERKLADL